ncbi:hypothetical protein GCM10009092_37810 [Bowmanella denitrificans]|uniref:Fibronectin type-III domain-containing protein n=1 Tax=Bowmanella denitrificans TaxID=366582 RepID=A0ABN0XQ08_9ALTE
MNKFVSYGLRATLLSSALFSPLLTLPVAAAPLSQAKAVFVGHSLINYDMPHMLRQMARSQGLSLENAVQVNNGTPLKINWETCHQADFEGPWPPQYFACDEIENAASQPFDVLIATDANNSINSNHVWNQTQVYLEQFTELLLSHNVQARSFLFTSWEELHYHNGDWLDAIDAELAEYEQIATEAEALSAQRGRHAEIQVIPVNLALKRLIMDIEQGRVPGLTSRTDLFVDQVHMNGIGNYYVASVVYSAVFGQSPEGASARMDGHWGDVLVDLPAAQAQALQSLAWQVVSDYLQLGSDQPAITNMHASANAQTWGIDLTWTPPAVPLQYYKLVLNGEVITALPGDAQSYELAWLEQRTEHQIRLQAYDFSHQLVAEAQISSYAGDYQAPTQPQGLSVSRSGEYGLSLSWQPASDDNAVALYKIYRNGQAYTHVAAPGFVDHWPPAGVNQYQIQAVDQHDNQSALSDVVSAPEMVYP